MLKEGQKIRGQDGRMMKVITPVMTLPIQYLVEFEDEPGQTHLVYLNHPKALDLRTDDEIAGASSKDARVAEIMRQFFEEAEDHARKVRDALLQAGVENPAVFLTEQIVKKMGEGVGG